MPASTAYSTHNMLTGRGIQGAGHCLTSAPTEPPRYHSQRLAPGKSLFHLTPVLGRSRTRRSQRHTHSPQVPCTIRRWNLESPPQRSTVR